MREGAVVRRALGRRGHEKLPPGARKKKRGCVEEGV